MNPNPVVLDDTEKNSQRQKYCDSYQYSCFEALRIYFVVGINLIDYVDSVDYLK